MPGRGNSITPNYENNWGLRSHKVKVQQLLETKVLQILKGTHKDLPIDSLALDSQHRGSCSKHTRDIHGGNKLTNFGERAGGAGDGSNSL